MTNFDNINWKTITIDEIVRIGINARDKWEMTPLHWVALEHDNPEIIYALLKERADFKAQDKYGKMPLHHAAEYNSNPKIILALTNACSNINARDKDKRTPLHYAAGIHLFPQQGKNNSNPEIISTLINASDIIDIGAQDIKGSTPLHYAGNNVTHEITLVLVKNEANPNAKNESGWMPLHCAAFHNSNPQVVETLFKKTHDPKAKTSYLDGEHTAYDLIQHNPALKDTLIYEELRKLCSD